MKKSLLPLLLIYPSLSLFASVVSMDRAEEIADTFVKPPKFFQVQVGPQGKYLTYIGFEDSTGKKRIYSMDLATLDSDERQIRYRFDGRPNFEITTYLWIDKENLFYSNSQTDRFSGGSFYSPGDLRGGNEVVLDDMGGLSLLDPVLTKERFSLWNRHRSGNIDKADPFPDVIQVDMRKGAFIELVENPGNIEQWITDTQGRIRVGLFDAGKGAGVMYREDEDSEWRRVSAPDPYQFSSSMDDQQVAKSMSLLAFLPGDTQMLTLVQNDEGLSGLQIIDTETWETVGNPIFREPYSLDEGYVLRHHANDYPVGYLYHSEKPQRLYLDKGYRGLAAALDKAMPETNNAILGFTESGEYAIIHSTGDTQPGVISKLHLQEGTLEPVIVRRAWIDRKTLSPMEPISFEARDGERIHGYLTLPSGGEAEGPYPLITIVHGGPAVRDTWGYRPEVQFFASLGYAVMQVNYRGSTGYGADYQGDSLLYALEKGVTDVADGVRWAIAEGYGEEGQIFIYGASFGGYSTAMSLMEEPDLYAAGVATMGVYDWEMLRDDDVSKGYAWIDELYHDMDEKMETYRRWSPRYQAEKLRSPLLVLHGGLDRRVNINQSRAFESALNKAGVEAEFKTTRWMRHGFMDAGTPEQKEYWLDIAAFFHPHIEN
jgi:dipeptidyl aminopeptidase/acylaminoacyl peptidase